MTDTHLDLPEELLDLPFGSPEFKDANERLAIADMENCVEVSKAMPPWVNVTGTTVCNLKCFMCNQALDPDIPKWFMSDEVYDSVVRELYPFAKMVQFSAFGEPLLYKNIEAVLEISKEHCPNVRNETVTDGDFVTPAKLRSLFDAGLDTLLISLYDGPEQVEVFQKMMDEVGLSDAQVVLRIR